MSIKNYRKKPVVVQAMRYTLEMTFQERVDLLEWGIPVLEIYADCIIISTLEGKMKASPGDYIIKGIKGEFYPCKPDIFEVTYEEV